MRTAFHRIALRLTAITCPLAVLAGMLCLSPNVAMAGPIPSPLPVTCQDDGGMPALPAMGDAIVPIAIGVIVVVGIVFAFVMYKRDH